MFYAGYAPGCRYPEPSRPQPDFRELRVPAVSVLMPVYNAGAFLVPAMQSMLRQTFTDFEFIVINDGSSDGSERIVREFAAADRRVVMLNQQNRGVAAALNRGVEMARAPLLARMDADDISLPRRLEIQVAAMQANTALAVLGGHVQVIDERGKYLFASFAPVGPRQAAKAALTHSPLTHSAVIMRKEAIQSVGGYRTFYESAEDYDLWLRLLDAGHAIDNLNIILLQYRHHAAGVSSAKRYRQALCTLLAQVASNMRRSGLSDEVLETGAASEELLRRAPVPFRPCEAHILEMLHGPAAEVPLERLLLNIASLDRPEQGVLCRRKTAGFLLRSACGLVKHGRFRVGLRTAVRAARMDGLVLPRQLGTSVGKVFGRHWRRLRFIAGRTTPAGHVGAGIGV